MSPQPPTTGQQIIVPDNVRLDIRSEENPDDARHRRWQETGLFFVALALFVVTFIVMGWFAFLSSSADAELRQAATGIFVTLAGALGGFIGGRASK